MKTRLTHLILATILVSSCNHTTVKINKDNKSCLAEAYDSNYVEVDSNYVEVEYTNTSSSKYIETTIKYIYSDGTNSTSTIKLKPGEIETECKLKDIKVSVVGEREIKENN